MKQLSTALLLSLITIFTSFGQNLPYVNHSEVGVLIGQVEDGDRVNFSLQTLHGVRINQNHDFGFLVGFDRYPGAKIVPFGMGWRGTLRPENKVSLFAGFDLGYGSMILERKIISEWGQHSWFEGGLMVHPTVGFQFRKRESSTMIFSLGYKRQGTTYFVGSPINDPWLDFPSPSNPDHWHSIRKDEIILRSMSVKLGFIFH
ncbi:hypothetical protein [Lunatibacter salilacus]|uniref:hypothetical protein n=1 Tax=Lunatibacter salilacus TaxID=2483804 RepID=UPI00131E7788|nr:hypothetical protein [Lunatibacter salilacus]